MNRLLVRRFRCLYTDCPQRIFAEKVSGLAEGYQRRSAAFNIVDQGRAGTRRPGELREVGVYDFALCRGHFYGTVLIDIAHPSIR